MNFQIES